MFPFNAGLQASSICPVPQRTIQGCCPEENRIYSYSDRKACCFQPNELMTYGQEKACCAPWKTGQTRWGQTSSSPCGGYCPPTSRMVSAGGYSSCCTDCALVDGVRAFETATSVCGTCCSRIPESCGNAGVRVCSSGTGSAYCSKIPGACNDHDDWLIGSYGEGGYTCCAKCTGTRFGETNSSCGTCCMPPDLVLSYSGVTSCCSSIALAGQNRWGRTESSVCGGYCDLATSSVYSYSGYTSCCKTCSEVLAFQSGPGNVCGTCCSAVPNNCGTAGTKVCESATGSAYCSKAPEKCTPATDWTVGTPGEGGYSCCPTCTGTRYNNTSLACGDCLAPVAAERIIQTSGTFTLDNIEGTIQIAVVGGGGGDAGYHGKYAEYAGSGGKQTTLTIGDKVMTAGGGGGGSTARYIADCNEHAGGSGGGGGRSGNGGNGIDSGNNRPGGNGGGYPNDSGGVGGDSSSAVLAGCGRGIDANTYGKPGINENPAMLTNAGNMGKGGGWTAVGAGGVGGWTGVGGGGGLTYFELDVSAGVQLTLSAGAGGAGGLGTGGSNGANGGTGGVVIRYKKLAPKP